VDLDHLFRSSQSINAQQVGIIPPALSHKPYLFQARCPTCYSNKIDIEYGVSRNASGKDTRIAGYNRAKEGKHGGFTFA
jgi:hypothetical protein